MNEKKLKKQLYTVVLSATELSLWNSLLCNHTFYFFRVLISTEEGFRSMILHPYYSNNNVEFSQKYLILDEQIDRPSHGGDKTKEDAAAEDVDGRGAWRLGGNNAVSTPITYREHNESQRRRRKMKRNKIKYKEQIE
uniref:Uncharacterized protein n=1 Tax=Romanomermis culicivorax TaxID=13658 RepID=A0A915J4B5_ROMCU